VTVVDDTAATVPRQRSVEWKFDLLDLALNPVPDVTFDPVRDNLVIDWDGSRTASRSLRGLVLDADVAAYLTADPGLRVRASFRINGGPPSVVGTFMLGQDTHQLWSGRHAYNFVDITQAADRSLAQSFSAPVGVPVEDVLGRLAALVPVFDEINIEPCGRYIGEPVNWPPTANLASVFNQLAITYGYFGLSTDPMGRAECRIAYDPADAVATVNYDTNGIVFVGTETEDRDLLSARDEWIVEVSAGQEYQRIGSYQLPVTHPAGRATRGFPTPDYSTSQAPGSVVDADAAARSIALSSPQAWQTRRWTSWVEAGHAGFVTVRRGGLNWLDQSWSIRVATGRMDHVVGRRVTP
jgi:hypothetical protein